ncbi:unnamed protein product, partial [Amoebophrya sp. A25]|eukprot:GSA25T00023339001.1
MVTLDPGSVFVTLFVEGLDVEDDVCGREGEKFLIRWQVLNNLTVPCEAFSEPFDPRSGLLTGIHFLCAPSSGFPSSGPGGLGEDGEGIGKQEGVSSRRTTDDHIKPLSTLAERRTPASTTPEAPLSLRLTLLRFNPDRHTEEDVGESATLLLHELLVGDEEEESCLDEDSRTPSSHHSFDSAGDALSKLAQDLKDEKADLYFLDEGGANDQKEALDGEDKQMRNSTKDNANSDNIDLLDGKLRCSYLHLHGGTEGALRAGATVFCAAQPRWRGNIAGMSLAQLEQLKALKDVPHFLPRSDLQAKGALEYLLPSEAVAASSPTIKGEGGNDHGRREILEEEEEKPATGVEKNVASNDASTQHLVEVGDAKGQKPPPILVNPLMDLAAITTSARTNYETARTDVQSTATTSAKDLVVGTNTNANSKSKSNISCFFHHNNDYYGGEEENSLLLLGGNDLLPPDQIGTPDLGTPIAHASPFMDERSLFLELWSARRESELVGGNSSAQKVAGGDHLLLSSGRNSNTKSTSVGLPSPTSPRALNMLVEQEGTASSGSGGKNNAQIWEEAKGDQRQEATVEQVEVGPDDKQARVDRTLSLEGEKNGVESSPGGVASTTGGGSSSSTSSTSSCSIMAGSCTQGGGQEQGGSSSSSSSSSSRSSYHESTTVVDRRSDNDNRCNSITDENMENNHHVMKDANSMWTTTSNRKCQTTSKPLFPRLPPRQSVSATTEAKLRQLGAATIALENRREVVLTTNASGGGVHNQNDITELTAAPSSTSTGSIHKVLRSLAVAEATAKSSLSQTPDARSPSSLSRYPRAHLQDINALRTCYKALLDQRADNFVSLKSFRSK